MRKWIVLSPEGDEVVSEEEIISGGYFDYWKSKMESKFGVDSELITKENCIEDWVVIHWAQEIKDND